MRRPIPFFRLATLMIVVLQAQLGRLSGEDIRIDLADRNGPNDSRIDRRGTLESALKPMADGTYASGKLAKWSDSIRSTTESLAFRERMGKALDTIPAHLQQGLRLRGWRVHLAMYVLDAAPELRGVHPRGWPAGATWDNTDAAHLPDQRLLIVAERRRTLRGQSVVSHRAEGAFRHELGHAFDIASGRNGSFQSSNPSFVAAVEKDRRQLAAEGRSQLLYYLQPDSAGRQEVFAEAFAIVLGGGSDVDRQREFHDAFPASIEFVRRSMAEFEPKP